MQAAAFRPLTLGKHEGMEENKPHAAGHPFVSKVSIELYKKFPHFLRKVSAKAR